MTDVPWIDVLAELRPDVDADILLVGLCGGAIHALTIREIVRGADGGLRIDRDAGGVIRATLRSDRLSGSSRVVESLRTLTFAQFVGASMMESM
jgi:hypothetical protein